MVLRQFIPHHLHKTNDQNQMDVSNTALVISQSQPETLKANVDDSAQSLVNIQAPKSAEEDKAGPPTPKPVVTITEIQPQSESSNDDSKDSEITRLRLQVQLLSALAEECIDKRDIAEKALKQEKKRMEEGFRSVKEQMLAFAREEPIPEADPEFRISFDCLKRDPRTKDKAVNTMATSGLAARTDHLCAESGCPDTVRHHKNPQSRNGTNAKFVLDAQIDDMVEPSYPEKLAVSRLRPGSEPKPVSELDAEHFIEHVRVVAGAVADSSAICNEENDNDATVSNGFEIQDDADGEHGKSHTKAGTPQGKSIKDDQVISNPNEIAPEEEIGVAGPQIRDIGSMDGESRPQINDETAEHFSDDESHEVSDGEQEHDEEEEEWDSDKDYDSDDDTGAEVYGYRVLAL